MTDDDREREAARKDPRQLELPFHATPLSMALRFDLHGQSELAKQLSPGPK
jgi:hypothetical protein